MKVKAFFIFSVIFIMTFASYFYKSQQDYIISISAQLAAEAEGRSYYEYKYNELLQAYRDCEEAGNSPLLEDIKIYKINNSYYVRDNNEVINCGADIFKVSDIVMILSNKLKQNRNEVR